MLRRWEAGGSGTQAVGQEVSITGSQLLSPSPESEKHWPRERSLDRAGGAPKVLLSLGEGVREGMSGPGKQPV